MKTIFDGDNNDDSLIMDLALSFFYLNNLELVFIIILLVLISIILWSFLLQYYLRYKKKKKREENTGANGKVSACSMSSINSHSYETIDAHPSRCVKKDSEDISDEIYLHVKPDDVIDVIDKACDFHFADETLSESSHVVKATRYTTSKFPTNIDGNGEKEMKGQSMDDDKAAPFQLEDRDYRDGHKQLQLRDRDYRVGDKHLQLKDGDYIAVRGERDLLRLGERDYRKDNQFRLKDRDYRKERDYRKDSVNNSLRLRERDYRIPSGNNPLRLKEIDYSEVDEDKCKQLQLGDRDYNEDNLTQLRLKDRDYSEVNEDHPFSVENLCLAEVYGGEGRDEILLVDSSHPSGRESTKLSRSVSVQEHKQGQNHERLPENYDGMFGSSILDDPTQTSFMTMKQPLAKWSSRESNDAFTISTPGGSDFSINNVCDSMTLSSIDSYNSLSSVRVAPLYEPLSTYRDSEEGEQCLPDSGNASRYDFKPPEVESTINLEEERKKSAFCFMR